MIALVQRVTKASVTFQKQTRAINKGFLVLLGVTQSDTQKDVQKLVHKLINLRIMADTQGKMNLSLAETGGEILLISQFTLIANIKKGFRPSFINAAETDSAKLLFDEVFRSCQDSGIPTKTGFFGQYMEVNLTNDGPTTIILDSEKI